MATKVDFCATALIYLGEEPINSLTADDDKTRACNNIYPVAKKEVLSRYPWRFTIQKIQLSRLVASPVNEYQYAFQLPSNRLGGPRAVYNNNEVGARPMTDYDIYEEYLFANDPAIWIDCQFDQNESKMPPYVQTLLEYTLAARLAMPITEDESKMQTWQTMAYGTPAEKQQGGYFELAKTLDSQQRPAQQISQTTDLIAVRN